MHHGAVVVVEIRREGHLCMPRSPSAREMAARRVRRVDEAACPSTSIRTAIQCHKPLRAYKRTPLGRVVGVGACAPCSSDAWKSSNSCLMLMRMPSSTGRAPAAIRPPPRPPPSPATRPPPRPRPPRPTGPPANPPAPRAPPPRPPSLPPLRPPPPYISHSLLRSSTHRPRTTSKAASRDVNHRARDAHTPSAWCTTPCSRPPRRILSGERAPCQANAATRARRARSTTTS